MLCPIRGLSRASSSLAGVPHLMDTSMHLHSKWRRAGSQHQRGPTAARGKDCDVWCVCTLPKSAQSGVFVVTAAVEAQHTGYAAREVLSQIFAATSDTVNSKLLPMYRAHMVRDITEESASLAGIGALSEGIFRYGPDHWQKRIIKSRLSAIQGLQSAAGLRSARHARSCDRWRPAVIEPQLKKEALAPSEFLALPNSAARLVHAVCTAQFAL